MIDTCYYYDSFTADETIAFAIAECFKLNPYEVINMNYEQQMKMYSYIIENLPKKVDDVG